jgi:hypothetical protein
MNGRERKGGMLEMFGLFFTHSLTNFVIFLEKEKKLNSCYSCVHSTNISYLLQFKKNKNKP